MECALQRGAPPPIMSLAWQCERWNALPDNGGLYEQEYRTIYLMSATLNIHNTVQRIRQLKGKDIHKLTEPERMILRMLMDNGILFR